MSNKSKDLAAAAEAVDDLPPGVSPLPPEQERKFLDRLLIDHTIERCAQVALQWKTQQALAIADAIMALKEKL